MVWISPAQVRHNEVMLSTAKSRPDGHWGGDFSLQNLLRCVFPVEMTKSQVINGGGENVGASRPHSHPLYLLGLCHFDQREKSPEIQALAKTCHWY